MMIKTQNLSRVFGNGTNEIVALNNLNLEIEEGDFVSIMGPSGCGKSTLLNILGLLDNPTSGEYYFNGQELSGLSERKRSGVRKANIGFVFQSFNLLDELTVFENVEMPLLYHKVTFRERKKLVRQVLEKMNLNDRAEHFPQELSGGQQQRVAVARAVVFKPRVILADEPTGNLDSKNGMEVVNLLKNLNTSGTTIIMVTHSLEYAECAKRVIKMLDGDIKE